jgi:hypothetical protein
VRDNLLFMQTTQRPTLLKHVELCVQKTGCGSLPIHPTHPISGRRLSSSSDMSRTAFRESRFNHMTNESLQLLVEWVRSQSRHSSVSSSIRWRESNGFLRTMVIIVHQLNIR